ncbi:MAG: peroxiredoxin [Methyloceanibacter sp.]
MASRPPINGGEAAHLKPGTALPRVTLPATLGPDVCLADHPGRSILIVYPWTGRPGRPNPPYWDDIPGAHGSTPEIEGFRDTAAEFAESAVNLFGLSRQTTGYQREMVERLDVPFPILSDAGDHFGGGAQLAAFHDGRRDLSQAIDADPEKRPHRSRVLPRARAGDPCWRFASIA